MHLCIMNTQSIGQIVKKSWQESGLSQKEFADAMNMSVRNLQYLFEKTDIHISQLARASAVLKRDFITDFLALPVSDSKYDYSKIYSEKADMVEEVLEKYMPEKKATNEITVQLTIKGELSSVSKYFPEMLTKIKIEADNYGLIIA